MIKLDKNVFSRFKIILNDRKSGNSREEKIVFSTLTNFASKISNLAYIFFTTPLLYNYLDNESFGILMTVISFLSILSFSDLGLGQSLQNNIPKYQINNDVLKIKESITTTFYFLIFLSIFILIIQYYTSNTFWISLLNINGKNIHSIILTIKVFFVCFSLILPLSIIQKINFAYQSGFWNDLWDISSNILSLILLIMGIYLKFQIHYLLLIILGSKILSLLFNFLHFFKSQNNLLPSIESFNLNLLKNIVIQGLLYLLLQISLYFLLTYDPIIISSVLGTEKLTTYLLSYRLFAIFIVPLQSFLGNSQPGINHAIESNDLNWIRQFFKKTFLYILMITLSLSILYYISANFILRNWINSDINLQNKLIFAFGFYLIFASFNSLLLSYIMAKKFIKKGVILYLLGAIVSLFFKYYLLKEYGIEILIWSSIISFFIFIFFPGAYLINKSLRIYKTF